MSGPTPPTGTVTFLFTDIEGSTRLLQRLGPGYPSVLEAHNRILAEAIEAVGGYHFGSEGDAMFATFERPDQAVAATVAAQRALSEHPWPQGERVRVRMGLHTGDGTLAGGSYVGLDVHRAARIAAAGHGGQVLLSEPTRLLAERDLPEGVSLLDLVPTA